MYVYKQTEPNLYTVGFYAPTGKWIPESDWSIKEEAIERVHYLNGGGISPNTEFILKKIAYSIKEIAKAIEVVNERQELADERAEILRRSHDRFKGKWGTADE